MNDRYFTERLFWVEDTNKLLHVVFVHGYGWIVLHEGAEADDPYFPSHVGGTYSDAMRPFNRFNYGLLVQEEG